MLARLLPTIALVLAGLAVSFDAGAVTCDHVGHPELECTSGFCSEQGSDIVCLVDCGNGTTCPASDVCTSGGCFVSCGNGLGCMPGFSCSNDDLMCYETLIPDQDLASPVAGARSPIDSSPPRDCAFDARETDGAPGVLALAAALLLVARRRRD